MVLYQLWICKTHYRFYNESGFMHSQLKKYFKHWFSSLSDEDYKPTDLIFSDFEKAETFADWASTTFHQVCFMAHLKLKSVPFVNYKVKKVNVL